MGKKHKSDPKSWKIKRGRKGREHIDNCNSGYNTNSQRFRQVHHIICVSSMADGTINGFITDNDARKLIRNCLAITDWDINAAPNCVSLPLKPAYLDGRAPTGWDGWPCHQVDHNPDYTDAVSSYLNDNIWNGLQEQAKKCEVDAKDLADKLNKASDKWRSFLETRGKSFGGTKHCWENQMSLASTWYRPFSMAPKPKKRDPVDYKGLTGNIQDRLKQLFQLH